MSMTRAAIVVVGLGVVVAIAAVLLLRNGSAEDAAAHEVQAQSQQEARATESRGDGGQSGSSDASEQGAGDAGSDVGAGGADGADSEQADSADERQASETDEARPFDLDSCFLASHVLQDEDWSPLDVVPDAYRTNLTDSEDSPQVPSDDFFKDLQKCLDPGEPLAIVTGLPKGSGVYTARDLEVSMGYGYAGDWEQPDDFAQNVGHCFVAPDGTPFRTVVTFSRGQITDGTPEGFVWSGGAIDIDVGYTTGDGLKAVVAVNLYGTYREPGYQNPAATIEAAYLSGLTGDEAQQTGGATEAQDSLGGNISPWKGYATMTSTYYDQTEYQNVYESGGLELDPWSSGDPKYTGVVTLFCG